MGMGGDGNKILVIGSEWALNVRHDGCGSGNVNKLIGVGRNENVASNSRTSLVQPMGVTLLFPVS